MEVAVWRDFKPHLNHQKSMPDVVGRPNEHFLLKHTEALKSFNLSAVLIFSLSAIVSDVKS